MVPSSPSTADLVSGSVSEQGNPEYGSHREPEIADFTDRYLVARRGKRAVPVRDHVVHEIRPFDLIAERHTPARPDLSHAVDGTVDGHRVAAGFVREAVCQVADGRLVTVAGRTVSEQDERRTLGSLRWRPQGAGNRPLHRFASNSELAYRPPGRVVGSPPAESFGRGHQANGSVPVRMNGATRSGWSLCSL